MLAPKPKTRVNTYSKKMRLKRRHEVCLEDLRQRGAMASIPVARFSTFDEAEAFAEELQKLLQRHGVERRDDGKVVPRARWENGLRSIVTVIGWVSKSFEIREVVDRVERIYTLAKKAGVKECDICGELELFDPNDEKTHLGHDAQGRLCHQRCAVKS